MTERRHEGRDRIIVGISGSSGVIYGVRLLEALKKYSDAEIHLVISPAAEDNIRIETDRKVEDVKALGDVVYKHNNLAASISSGSFRTAGMIVVPCSMKSLSEIAYSNSNNLLARAADVCLKQRRKLVLAVRDAPFNRIHLENMLRAQLAGAVIFPIIPTFYDRPKTLDDLVNQFCCRVLALLDLEQPTQYRWQGERRP